MCLAGVCAAIFSVYSLSAFSTAQSLATSTTSRLTSASPCDGVDAAEPEVVGGHVQHRADVAEAIAEPGAHDAAARGLEHRHVDRRVAQHHARGDFGPVMSPFTVTLPSM